VMKTTRRDEGGAAAVEMALVTPLLFMLVFGVIVFGITFFRLQSMQAAVREGGRLAAVRAEVPLVIDRVWAEQQVVNRATDGSGLSVRIFKVELDADGGSPERIEVFSGAACDATAGTDGWGVEVTAELSSPDDYALSMPFVPQLSPDMSSRAVFQCE
jgi:Flp pilus assembly protein TadG